MPETAAHAAHPPHPTVVDADASRLLDQAVNRPVALEAGVHSRLVMVLARHAAGVRVAEAEVARIVADRRERDERLAASRGSDRGERGYAVRGSVAVIGIGGVIARHAHQVNGSSQPRGTAVESVRGALADARADKDVGSVLLHIDSPGGSVDGLETLAQEVYAARQDGLAVWTVFDGVGASAAYWIGSQGERLFAASATDEVGSIGVRLLRLDESRALANEGLAVHSIVSGPDKDIGLSVKPMSESERAKLQAMVDEFRDLFVRAVARGRGMTIDAVLPWATGGVWTAEKAQAMGLIDGVRPVAEVLAEMNRRFRSRRDGGGMAAAGGVGPAAADGRAGSIALNVNVGAWPAGGGGVQAGTPAGPAGSESRPTQGGAMSAQQLNNAAGGVTPAAGGAAPANTPPTNGQATSPSNTPADNPDSIRLDAVRAERDRVAAIEVLARDYGHIAGVAEACAAARADGSGPDAVRGKVLDLVKAGAAPTGTIEVGASGFERRLAGIEAAMLARYSPAALEACRSGGERGRRVAEAIGFDDPAQFVKAHREAVANGVGRLRLMQVAEACAEQALGGGRRAWRDDNEVLAAVFGHSSSDFPRLLANVSQKTLMAAFAETPTTYDRWCAIGSSSDFKTRDVITLSELPNLELLPEGASPNEASFNERYEQVQVRTYARKFSVTRNLLVNDDLGGIMRMNQQWGVAAARLPESLAWGVITANAAMSDGTALFHANHNNLESATALSETSLESAATKMMTQRGFGPDQAELFVEPAFLLVPSNLLWTAKKILKSVASTVDNKSSGVVNPVMGIAEPIASPYLYRASTTAWYLTASPSLLPLVEVTFLNGNRAPIVTRVGSGSILGQEFEIVFDAAAKSIHWEAGVRNPGA